MEINWYDFTLYNLRSNFPEIHSQCPYLVARLTALLFERISPELGHELLNLLPKNTAREFQQNLQTSADSKEDFSIGYPQFIETAYFTLGCMDLPPETENTLSYNPIKSDPWIHKLVDSFLENMTQNLPIGINTRLQLSLPSDLRHLVKPAS